VNENRESVNSATANAAKERNANVDNFDYQRRGTAPKARDEIAWPEHTKVGLAQAKNKEEPAAAEPEKPAAEGDAAKPKAEGEAKPAAEGDAKPKAEGEAKPAVAEGDVKPAAEGDAKKEAPKDPK